MCDADCAAEEAPSHVPNVSSSVELLGRQFTGCVGETMGPGRRGSDRLQVDSLCGGTEGGSGGVLSELLLPPDI